MEADTYAVDFGRVLERGNWDAGHIPNMAVFSGNPPVGILVQVKEPNETGNILLQALLAAGIQVQGVLMPNMRLGDVELVIGAKPPPNQ